MDRYRRRRFVLPGATMGVSSASLSADGRYLAACFHHMVDKRRIQQQWKVWEVATGKERSMLPAPPAGHATLQFAPTGSLLAVWNYQKLEVWDAATGKVRVQVTVQSQLGRPMGIQTVSFARDGQHLVYAFNDGRVVLHDCVSGNVAQEWKLPALPSCLSISSDGRQVALGSRCGLVKVRRLPGTTAKP